MTVAEFFARLATHAPGAPALHDAADQCIDYRAMQARVAAQSDELRAHGMRVLGTQLDNGVDWAVADLAALHAGMLHVPLPLFFTAAQAEHALRASGADSVLDRRADGALRRGAACRARHRAACRHGEDHLYLGHHRARRRACACRPSRCSRLRRDWPRRSPRCGIERHLCALPLAVLLENIAGLYAPLLAGATVVVPPLAVVGLERLVTLRPGAARCRGGALRRAQRHHAAADAARLDGVARCAGAAHSSLRFVAAGGAAVGAVGPFAGARVRTCQPTKATDCPKALRCRRSTCRAPIGRAAPAVLAARARAHRG